MNRHLLILFLSLLCTELAFARCTNENVRDTFSSLSYSLNNGSQNWVGNWQEIGESDGVSAGQARVSNSNCTSGYCLRIGTPTSSGPQYTNRGARREVNLSNASSATLTFNYFTGFGNGTANVSLEVSNDGGTNWTQLRNYTINSTSFTATPQSFDLTPYIAPNTQIRFIGSGSIGSRTGMYIDDIDIAYNQCLSPTAITDVSQLDFEGNFVYAVNFNGSGAQRIQDATFTNVDQASGGAPSGVSISRFNQTAFWNGASNLGTSADNNTLENVMRSLIWASSLDNGQIDMDVEVGAEYRLQLLFSEGCCNNRHFDVDIETSLMNDEIIGTSVGGTVWRSSTTQGYAIITEFTATDPVLDIDFSRHPPGDTNYHISGFTLEKTQPAPTYDQPEMLAGRVTLNNTINIQEFTRVCFARPFSETPLVFSLPTDEGSDPTVHRIRNVTTTGFEIAQVEGSGSDGPYIAQTIDFIAIVPGEYNLEGGAQLEVGSVSTTRFRAKFGNNSNYENITFQSNFSSTPAIIAAIQTMNNETANPPSTPSVPFLSTSIRNITTNNFDLALGRMESPNGTINTPELIGYMAIESGKTGEFNPNINYQSVISAQNITGFGTCRTTALSGFSSQPLIFASKNTHNGGDGGWVRRCSIANNSVGLYIEEDIDSDTERDHTEEIAGILALGGNFTDFTNSCPATVPDHFSISHDGSAINCLPETITISAHDSAHNILTSYTGTVTISTNTNHGDWGFVTGSGGNAANLINNGNGAGSYNFDGTENGSVTLSLFNPFEEVININVTDGTISETSGSANSANDDPDLRYEASGFIFDVPTLTACKTSTDITIRAVKNGTGPSQCISALTGNKTLSFWSDYDIPASGTTPVQVNSTAVATSNTGTAINLTFNTQGEAQFTAQYDDAGRLNLNAKYDDGAGLVMTGSDSFVSTPVTLVSYSDDSGANCASQDASCSVFKKAGQTFNLKVKAACWTHDADTDFTDNPETPNFELASIGITHSVIAPAGVNGQIATNSFNFSTSNQGAHTVQQTVSEVGVFEFDVILPTYLGETLTSTPSNAIGRFTPDYFTATTTSNGSFGNNACTGFSYSGQAFTYQTRPQLTITAYNTDDEVTQNYRGDFAKLQDTDFSVTSPSSDAVQLGSDNATLVALDWQPAAMSLNDNNNGTLTFEFGNDQYTYRHEANSRIAPFTNAVDLTFTSISDSDNITTTGLPHTLQPSGEPIRFGRIAIDSTHGSELVPLTTAIRVEYFNGFSWIENTADACTVINQTNHLGLRNPDTSGGTLQSGNTTMTIGAGSTSATLSNANPLSSGSASLTLSAPGQDNQGYVDVSSRIGASYPWLLGDYDNSGSYNNEAQGRVSFGLFRGSNNIIFRRERF